jgi:dTDP-4-dehydrorhamnose reductase
MAVRTAEMVERNFHGVFHLGGGEAISWFDYAAMIFQLAGLSPALEPTTEKEYRTPARRPKYSALSNSKLEGAGVAPMPPLREALQEYLRAREHAISHRSA